MNPLNSILREKLNRREVLELGAMSIASFAVPGLSKATKASPFFEEVESTRTITDWISPVSRLLLDSSPAALIPFPKQPRWSREWLDVSGGFELTGDEEVFHGVVLNWPIPAHGRSRVPVRVSVQAGITPQPEGYLLTIDSKGVAIVGSDYAGAFYAVQTLRQLTKRHKGGSKLPCGSVRDWPAFAVRGFMQDTGRNFQAIDALKAQIDLAAAYKVNVFHWHLTDRPAWRIQSRLYPQLNDPRFRAPTRDPNSTYSFHEIRDVIAYARARHVQVLPEIDMPGHSDYFTKAFGFPMTDPRGQAIVERLLDEFCSEISEADCPWLHIGSDEVRISDPAQFVSRMSAKVRSLGRLPVMWNPGLPNDGTLVEQTWSEPAMKAAPSAPSRGTIDSSMGYPNNYGALEFVQRYYFAQPCLADAGNDRLRGAIVCIWPDIRVVDKQEIERQNAVWPAILTLSESAWVGRPSHGETLRFILPDASSTAGRDFQEFENRLAAHRDTSFDSESFPFVKSSAIPWLIAGPFLPSDADRPSIGPPAQIMAQAFGRRSVKHAWGGAVTLSPRSGGEGIFPHPVISDVYAVTWVHSEQGRIARAWVGFETPDRSNREYGGIPQQGQWDTWDANIWVNDTRVQPPLWRNPGKYKYLRPTWGTSANEIPLTDEELYWTREPAFIPLVAGWNRILIKVPCGYVGQNWSFTFVAVHLNKAGRWVEDESLTYGVQPVERSARPNSF